MTVWLCSGQGAQKPGMGADLLVLPEVSSTFKEMSAHMGINLGLLAMDGTPDEVNEPVAAQALTMAVSVGVGKSLFAAGKTPDAIVGFSLGEISGLVLSGILTLSEATELLKVRATSMSHACKETPGAMTALLGAEAAEAEALAKDCANGQVLIAANYNAPGQVVISGEVDAIERAEAAWKESGKRFARLATAGAFHTPLMETASIAVGDACEALDFKNPSAPLICNTDASPFKPEEAKERLSSQVKMPVLFEQSVKSLIESGETEFVEVGFGGVLINLVKRIDRSTQRYKIGTLEEFEEYVR